jgi:hypothetical protein
MKTKFNVKQPTPDEIISDFFKTHDNSEIFVQGDVNILTSEGKAIFALGISCYNAFKKAHK